MQNDKRCFDILDETKVKLEINPFFCYRIIRKAGGLFHACPLAIQGVPVYEEHLKEGQFVEDIHSRECNCNFK